MTKKIIHTYKYLLYILFHLRSIDLIREDVNQYKSNIATRYNLQGANIYVQHIKIQRFVCWTNNLITQVPTISPFWWFLLFEKQRQTNYLLTHAPTIFSQCQIMVYCLTYYLHLFATFFFPLIFNPCNTNKIGVLKKWIGVY